MRVLTSGSRFFVDIIPELTQLGKLLTIFTTEDGRPIKSAGYWWYNGERVGDSAGEPAVKARLLDDRDFRAEIAEAVRQRIADLSKAQIINYETGEMMDEPSEGGE